MTGEQDLNLVEESVRARNNIFGIRLFLGADASFFLAFFFAYLYLKTIDTQDLWNGGSPGASVLLGILQVAGLAGAAVLTWQGGRRVRAGLGTAWRSMAWIAVALALVALVAMAWQLATIGYYPGGYDSVLIGWTAALAVHVLIATPLLVGSALERRPAGPLGPLDLAGITATTWFWGFLAAVAAIEFVLLDLVR